MNFDHIPAELQAERRFVVARHEPVNGRTTKVPYCAFEPSRKASSVDPATWSDFQTARRAVEGGRVPLLGFVLGVPYIGVDLDKCRNAESGAIEPWASDIVECLDAYTEISVSGTGVHVICRGELPAGGRRKGSIEMYDSARYFVVTGDSIRGSSIEHRTAALANLHARIFGTLLSTALVATFDPADQRGKENIDAGDVPRPVTTDDGALLATIRASQQGEKFGRLWAGDTSLHGGDHSVADLALCSILAFWTQCDAERIDRLFRQSKLTRSKWERRADYRRSTIDKAISSSDSYQPPIEIPDLPLELQSPIFDLDSPDVERL